MNEKARQKYLSLVFIFQLLNTNYDILFHQFTVLFKAIEHTVQIFSKKICKSNLAKTRRLTRRMKIKLKRKSVEFHGRVGGLYRRFRVVIRCFCEVFIHNETLAFDTDFVTKLVLTIDSTEIRDLWLRIQKSAQRASGLPLWYQVLLMLIGNRTSTKVSFKSI